MQGLILLTVCDLFVVGAATANMVPAGLALATHFLLTLATVAVWWRRSAPRRFAPVLSLALGPVGILCALIAPAFGAIVPRAKIIGQAAQISKLNRAKHRAQWSEGVMVARLLDGRVRHPDPASLGSLISIMRQGSLDHRRRALETAVRSFDPRLSKVVALALTDDDQTIRALAAAAANRLARRLAEDRLALVKALADGDKAAAMRLCTLLTDHSRFDVLLSGTQRDQIRSDVGKALDRFTEGELCRADAEEDFIRNLNQSWAARDFEMIDRLCADAGHKQHQGSEPLWSTVSWWAAQQCS